MAVAVFGLIDMCGDREKFVPCSCFVLGKGR